MPEPRERALPELVPPGATAAQAAAAVLAAREGLPARTAAGGEVAEDLPAATAAVLGALPGRAAGNAPRAAPGAGAALGGAARSPTAAAVGGDAG
ncbi:hypothetical protein OH807_08220 [Kitasatospora sp. NBC_01560]|uniref:hypothetical protein n=1 Tax=Kitasatospora sp. NBC_01560 TaxID=2975965 RepID=UPI0038638B0D